MKIIRKSNYLNFKKNFKINLVKNVLQVLQLKIINVNLVLNQQKIVQFVKMIIGDIVVNNVKKGIITKLYQANVINVKQKIAKDVIR